MSSINSIINTAVDTSVNTSILVTKGVITTIPRSAVGMLTAWVGGASLASGAIQAAIANPFSRLVIQPIEKYVNENNERKTPDRLNDNAARILRIITRVAAVTVPILLTMYTGNAILAGLGMIAPTFMKGIFLAPIQNYTLVQGCLISTSVFIGVDWLPSIVVDYLPKVYHEVRSAKQIP